MREDTKVRENDLQYTPSQGQNEKKTAEYGEISGRFFFFETTLLKNIFQNYCSYFIIYLVLVYVSLSGTKEKKNWVSFPYCFRVPLIRDKTHTIRDKISRFPNLSNVFFRLFVTIRKPFFAR